MLTVLVFAIKLCPYFESHTIGVRTDYPLQKVLHRSEPSGRLSIWAVILSAFDIRYVPRKAMKAQAVANFIAKITPSPETFEPMVKEWKIWADGACGAWGSGIRILLQIQPGIKLWYAAKLTFSTKKNVAEYETIVIALRIIAKIDIQKSIIFSNS